MKIKILGFPSQVVGLFLFSSFVMLNYQNCGSGTSGEPARVQIQIPEAVQSQKIKPAVLAHASAVSEAPVRPTEFHRFNDIWAPAFEPTSTTDLNCFGVVIGSDDGEISGNTCETFADATPIDFGVSSLGALAGELLSLEATEGPGRTITVLGWRTETEEACLTLRAGTDVDSKKISHPYVIGTLTTDLVAGDNVIDIQASFTGATQLNSCDVFTASPTSLSGRSFRVGGSVIGLFDFDDRIPIFAAVTVPFDDGSDFPLFGENGFVDFFPLLLSNNVIDVAEIFEDGFDFFDIQLADGQPYNVEIQEQPSGKQCTVSNGSGVIDGQDVTDISVNCIDELFSLSGTVAGLNEEEGESVTLQDFFGGESISVDANGGFSFDTPVLHGDFYDIGVLSSPFGHSCFVSNSFGGVNDADVTDIAVSCDPNIHFVEVDVTGLIEGRNLVLQNNDGDNLNVSFDANFVFNTGVAFGNDYSVTISSQPVGQTCTVVDGSGTMSDGNVTIDVNCVPLTFSVQGVLSNFIEGRDMTIELNSNSVNESQELGEDGSFQFESRVPSGESYSVSITVPADGMDCSVSNGTGVIIDQDITDVSIDCTPQSFFVGGNVNGHPGEAQLSLTNTENGSVLNIFGDTFFNFPDQTDSGEAYNVTVTANPPGHTCSVTNGSGTVFDSNINNISVDCVPNTVSIGGSVAGLDSGDTLILRNNGADQLNLTEDGSFVFANEINEGSSYDVTIFSAPSGKFCILTDGQGTANTDINNISVDCVPVAIGVVDTTFQNSGVLRREHTSGNAVLPRVRIDSNGKLVFAGSISFGTDYELCRFESDGSVDTGFAGGVGCLRINALEDFPEASVQFIDMILDAQDQAIVVGRVDGQNAMVNRHLSSGPLDSTFGSSGTFHRTNTCSSGAGFSSGDLARAVITDPATNDVFVVGSSSVTGSSDQGKAWWSLTSSGTLETSFIGNQGVPGITCSSESSGTEFETLDAVLLDSYGRSVAGGQFDGDVRVIRLLSDGSPDASFGNANPQNGVLSLDLGESERVFDLEIDSQGRIYVGIRKDSAFNVARLNTDGTLDTSYGTGGIASTSLAGDETLNAMALDAAGQVVAVGTNANQQMQIVRFTTDGTFDTSFGSNGFLLLSSVLGGTNQSATDLAIDDEGNIFVSGFASNGSGDDDAVIIKIR